MYSYKVWFNFHYFCILYCIQSVKLASFTQYYILIFTCVVVHAVGHSCQLLCNIPSYEYTTIYVSVFLLMNRLFSAFYYHKHCYLYEHCSGSLLVFPGYIPSSGIAVLQTLLIICCWTFKGEAKFYGRTEETALFLFLTDPSFSALIQNVHTSLSKTKALQLI